MNEKPKLDYRKMTNKELAIELDLMKGRHGALKAYALKLLADLEDLERGMADLESDASIVIDVLSERGIDISVS